MGPPQIPTQPRGFYLNLLFGQGSGAQGLDAGGLVGKGVQRGRSEQQACPRGSGRLAISCLTGQVRRGLSLAECGAGGAVVSRLGQLDRSKCRFGVIRRHIIRRHQGARRRVSVNGPEWALAGFESGLWTPIFLLEVSRSQLPSVWR